jgi:hypothetical protein
MSKSLNFALVIIAALILVACATTGESGAGSETSKTFINEQFGYSFEVPESCTIGPMPTDCKQSPPEERPEECLCFVDGTDPEFVSFQEFTITDEETTLASINILSPETQAYSPDPGADLVTFLQQEWSEMNLDALPDQPNLDFDGLPAVSILIPQSQGGAAAQEIFFIKDNRLFKISMINNLQASNVELYDHFLESFTLLD